jgi:ELWxxDGT repeat protein
MPKSIVVAVAVACAWIVAPSPSRGESPPGRVHRVSDFHAPAYPTQRVPASLLALDSRVLYLANDRDFGGIDDLWASDGTAAGTHKLREMCGANSYCDLQWWVSMGSFAIIRIGEGAFEQDRLWRSDGTAAGTFPLTGALPTSAYTSEHSYEHAVAGPFVYFGVCDDDLYCAIWSSDGTVDGTTPVDTSGKLKAGHSRADIPGFSPGGLVAWHDDVYFLGYDDDGDGLWRASRRDGRLDKVRALAESYPPPSSLVLAGERLFFVADNGGRELWTSDGTAAGTVPVSSFPRRTAIPECASLTALGGRVWFAADDGAYGWELWRSDGTPAGTQRATDFKSRRPFGETDEYGPSLPGSHLAWLNGKLVFASVATSGSPRLWTTDGDPRSTAPLSGCPGGCPFVIEWIPLVTIGNRAAFFGYRPNREPTLWVTDGTGAGTGELPALVKEASESGALDIAAAGGRWFVNGDSLWATDGTAAGTVRLATTGDPGWRGLAPTLAAVSGSVFFRARNAAGLVGLWQTTGAGAREVFTAPVKTYNYLTLLTGNAGDRVLLSGGDGCWGATAEGMAPLPDTATDSGCGSDTEIALSGPRAFVVKSWETTLTGGTNFWSTDGTPEGTTAIRLRDADVRSNVVSWDDGARALFASAGGLWATDGTAAGTRELVALPSLPWLLVAADGVVYFVLETNGATKSEQLWSSDGTAVGTGPVTPSWAAITSQPVVLDGRVHLLAKETADSAVALWTFDPADDSVRSLSLSELGARNPAALTGAAGRLWFAARTPRDESERWWLWTTDGTATGTRRLPAIMSLYPWSPAPLPLTTLGDKVYFANRDAEHDRELWKSNGTVVGTSIVDDLAPSLADGAPRSNVVVWRGRLWFAADDGVHGVELWSSDGTARGTRLEADLNRGVESSRPSDLTVAGDRLYFAAADGTNGLQLWAVD